MPTTITDRYAIEQSTFIVPVSFTDSSGDPVVPNAGLVWKLTDRAGAVVNSRSAVAIAPASSVDIVLTGNDLAMQTGEGTNAKRVVTVSGTYDSTEGSGLAIKDECIFTLRNLIAIP